MCMSGQLQGGGPIGYIVGETEWTSCKRFVVRDAVGFSWQGCGKEGAYVFERLKNAELVVMMMGEGKVMAVWPDTPNTDSPST